jgi:tricorn protease
VGKRTWGGVIGISPTHRLADGSVTTQPEYAFWFVDVGWSVENYGTDPDYDVDIRPQDHVAGQDPQLDKAIDLARRALRRHRPVTPDLLRRPRLSLPLLPTRVAGDGRREPSGAQRERSGSPGRVTGGR